VWLPSSSFSFRWSRILCQFKTLTTSIGVSPLAITYLIALSLFEMNLLMQTCIKFATSLQIWTSKSTTAGHIFKFGSMLAYYITSLDRVADYSGKQQFPLKSSVFFPMAQHFNLFLLLLQILSLLLVSSAQTRPPVYFMSVGSKSDITVNDRTFYGDMNPGTFSIGKNSPVTAKAVTNNPLYQTARIFLEPSSYEFDIIDHGVYFVRLHFYPYMLGKENLAANIKFDVSLANYSLLSDFAVKQNDVPVIEEFLVPISDSKFSINFTPHPKSLAFVNAIEVFLHIPNGNLQFLGWQVDNPAGVKNVHTSDRPVVLHTLHRLNVGGPLTSDSRWRTWKTDDTYVPDKRYQKTCPPFTGDLRYDVLSSSKTTAPDIVYNTCKELSSETSIITWHLDVGKSARHMIRMHFCDIVSPKGAAASFTANFYNNVDGVMVHATDSQGVEQLDAPFYVDYLVDSDALALMDITIIAKQYSKTRNAYMNGIEVFEFTKLLN
jgi:hypothetical protein